MTCELWLSKCSALYMIDNNDLWMTTHCWNRIKVMSNWGWFICESLTQLELKTIDEHIRRPNHTLSPWGANIRQQKFSCLHSEFLDQKNIPFYWERIRYVLKDFSSAFWIFHTLLLTERSSQHLEKKYFQQFELNFTPNLINVRYKIIENLGLLCPIFRNYS